MIGIVSGRTADPVAGRRSALRDTLLGPDTPSALDRLDRAIAALADRDGTRQSTPTGRGAAKAS